MDFDHDSLLAMKRKDLQALAKKHGIRANMKSADIVTSLLELSTTAKDQQESEGMEGVSEVSEFAAEEVASEPAPEPEVAEVEVSEPVPQVDATEPEASEPAPEVEASEPEVETTEAEVEEAEVETTEAEVSEPVIEAEAEAEAETTEPEAMEVERTSPEPDRAAAVKAARAATRREESKARKSKTPVKVKSKLARPAKPEARAPKVLTPRKMPNYDTIHARMFSKHDNIASALAKAMTPTRKMTGRPRTPVATGSAKKALVRSASHPAPVRSASAEKRSFIPYKGKVPPMKSNSTTPKKAARPVFDLNASLARPLGYKPKTGPLVSPAVTSTNNTTPGSTKVAPPAVPPRALAARDSNVHTPASGIKVKKSASTGPRSDSGKVHLNRATELRKQALIAKQQAAEAERKRALRFAPKTGGPATQGVC